MNQYQQDISSKSHSINQFNDNEKKVSKNRPKRKNIGKEIKKFQLFVCLTSCFNRLIKNWNICQSKCAIPLQLIIFLIPLSIILFFSIYMIHFFGFERIFKFDYFFAVEKEYLNYLIKDFDETHFEIGSKEIKSQLEDIDNIYFFEIYFQELISMGLLEEDSPKKIFPNISLNSENLYKSIDDFQKDNNIDSVYTIPQNETKQFIDEREDNLSEIAKLYYYFLPLITYGAFTKKTYINESFLIAYEFNSLTKEIENDTYLYFSYPVKANQIIRTNNFFPNSLMSPQISCKKPNHGEKFNNSFYKENWFAHQDYKFRSMANPKNASEIIFSNLNYVYYGKLNKSNIVSLQSYFYLDKLNKSYIINIIYYINQKKFKEESLEFSAFLLFNDSLNKFQIVRYSDNNTFLVSQLNIAELTLASTTENYFHYGMLDKNYNFFKYGVSYDSMDLEVLGEPLNFYRSNDNFIIDLRYFSSLYLYSSLFRKLKFSLSNKETKEINEINFINNKDTIQNICKEINFNSYINYLESRDINCFDHNNLLYYSGYEAEQDIFYFNFNIMPYCICLPLYCLQNLEEDIELEDIKKNNFINKMTLPSKCQNTFQNYLNGVNENFKNHSIYFEVFLKINFGLNNIKFLTSNLKESVEDEYYIFKSIKFTQLPKIIFMIIALIDNSNGKRLLTDLLIKLETMKSFYLIIELIGSFIAFLIGIVIIFIKVMKISKIIFEYKKIHDNYLYKLESENHKEISQDKKYNNSNFDSNLNLGNINNYSNNNGLTKNIPNLLTNNNFYKNDNSNDNILLHELSLLFRKYYKINKVKNIKKEHHSSHLNKDKYMEEKNELFQLLRILSIYIPQFKINVSIDYNFYINTKLNVNYIKSISKRKHEEQNLKLLTQCVLFELLSTENINNYGPITNFNFKYITNINYDDKKENSSIKNSLFALLEKIKDDEKKKSDTNKILLKSEDSKDDIRIIWKEKSRILEEFWNNFENDDYLKKDKINSIFESYLINGYYKYIKKIVTSKSAFLDDKIEEN